MKNKIVIILVMLLVSGNMLAQTQAWFEKEMHRLVGTWVASNKEYLSENETDDSYAIEWKWGAAKKSVLGVLFGMKDGSRTNEYWQFIQYWDTRANKVKVIQVSFYGAIGEGYLELENGTDTQLVQEFTNPDGSSTTSGHKTKVFEDHELSTSYDIINGNWEKRRSYTWYKQ